MRSSFVKFLALLALANAFVFFAVQWGVEKIISPYQLQRISEESYALVAEEIPHFELLQPAQWSEAARTVHERWRVPGKLTTIEQSGFVLGKKSNAFDNRVQYRYTFSHGAYALILLKNNSDVLEVGPLPGLAAVSALDGLFASMTWLIVNAAAIAWLILGIERRAQSIEKATSAFLSDGTARLLDESASDSLGLAARSINQMAIRAEHILKQRQQMIHEQRELLHAVAHECRAPLARLNFALEMLQHAGNEQSRAQLSRDMESAISELDSLVRELLAYARLHHGSQKLEFSEVDIAAIADDVLGKTKTLFPVIAFASQAPMHAFKVQVDARLLTRCLTNLIRNAASFATRRVDVSWYQLDQHFVIAVDDDGPGVPPDQRERIFDPFIRLDPSRSRDSGGTGLGLAIVKGISERHHGEVYVNDSELGGARFVLRWPLRAEAQS